MIPCSTIGLISDPTITHRDTNLYHYLRNLVLGLGKSSQKPQLPGLVEQEGIVQVQSY